MSLNERGLGTMHFATGDLPAAQRLPALRDIYDRQVRMHLDTAPDRPVAADLTVHVTPGLRRTRMVCPIASRLIRDGPHLSDGEDAVCLVMKSGGRMAISQLGREAEPRDGDATLLIYREPGALQFSDMRYSAVRVPYAELAALSRNVAVAAARRIPGGSEPLRLLRAYLSSLPTRFDDPQLARLAASHVYDLIALCIGSIAECRNLSQRHGLRAARYEALKSDLTRDPEVKLDQLAARHGISPRYVQILFEEAGTSYSAFATDLKLEAARAVLISPRFAAHSVTAVAFDAGFGDLSYFNRCFKRRYGMTPSEARSLARGET